jgi:diaminopimelate epimerase
MILPFHKYHGTGNDFILIDDRKALFPINQNLLQNLCDRHMMIGADGVILVQKSVSADFRMRIFNSDGKEANFCGNACLSFLHFLYHYIEKKDRWKIETNAGIIPGKKEDVGFSFELPVVKWIGKYKLSDYEVHRVDVGVSHGCVFVDDLKNFDVVTVGKNLRWHPEFSPGGVNVNFIQIKDNSSIFVRTFEKGVENETKACGSGAIASAYTAFQEKGLDDTIKVIFERGNYRVKLSDDKIISLQGNCENSFNGSILI